MRYDRDAAMSRIDGDRAHPMFPEPVYWQLVEFTFRGDPTDWQESYIDLVFEVEGERRFRFSAPQAVEWAGRLPVWSGLLILDITARQWEGMRVLVCRTEPMQLDGPQFR